MKFRNYKNSFNNSNRIFSDDDVLDMTLRTLFDKENDVLAQNRAIGMPTIDELQNSQNTLWVEPSIDEYGNEVKGHWTSLPNTLPPINENGAFQLNATYNQPIYNTAAQEKPQVQENLSANLKTNLPGNKSVNNWEIKATPLNPIQNALRNAQLNTWESIENVKNTLGKYKGLTPKAAAQKAFVKNLPDVHSSEKEYYEHGAKLADGEEPTDFMKEQNDFYKLSDIKDENLKKMYVDKLSQMHKKDMSLPENYEQIKNFNIVIPKKDSQLHSQIKNSETTQKWIAENYDSIKNQTNKNKSLTYPIIWDNDNAQRSLGLTLHKTDMSNAKVHKDGSFSVFPTDIPDYDHLEKKAYKIPEVNDKGEKLSIKEKIEELGKIFAYNFVVGINNNALEQQKKKQYLKYLLSTDVTYTKKEMEEILKKYKESR